MKRVSVKAVLIGGFADMILSGLLGIPLMIVVVARGGFVRVPREQLQAALVKAIHATPAFYAAQLLIGVVCTVLGGFIAARVAKHDHLLNGIASSIVCMAVGIYSIAAGKTSQPLAVDLLLLLVVTPLCGLAGGYLAKPKAQASSTVDHFE